MKKNFVLRFGLFFSTFIATFLVMVISGSIASFVVFLSGIEFQAISIVLPLGIPLLLVPPTVIIFGRLLIKIAKMEEQMRQLATYDQLTSLLSRHAVLDSAEALLSLAIRKQSPISLLYIDLDHFKSINDTFGHDTGDEVLRFTGELLVHNKRKSDLAGRLGGEEFLIVLPDTNSEGAAIFAEKIREKIEAQNILHDNKEIAVSASIGVSVANKNFNISLDELIKHADRSLFDAKNAGRNCVKVCTL